MDNTTSRGKSSSHQGSDGGVHPAVQSVRREKKTSWDETRNIKTGGVCHELINISPIFAKIEKERKISTSSDL